MRATWLFLILFCCPAAHAAVGEGGIACRSGSEDNQPYKKKLWDGYEISLGPARNAEETGLACTAAIYNSAGRVVFRTNGFGVIFDEDLTGEDFDGDGKPEVVFQTDEGGGAHCCWIYNIISLFPKPHHLFDVGSGAAMDFEKDKAGRMVIWERTPGPSGWTSGADRPYAERVFRVLDEKLADSTPEFCQEAFARGSTEYGAQLSSEKLKNLSSGMEQPDDETASALLSRALQHVFCREFDAALQDLDLWPEATRDDVKSDFADSIRKDYPEFAARLESGN